MLGNDIRSITDDVLGIITTKEVIAVNQDPLGRQGQKVHDDGDLEVWCKELKEGSRAVRLFNRSEEKQEIGLEWYEVGLPQNLKL
jgi:alpha-galactosidase